MTDKKAKPKAALAIVVVLALGTALGWVILQRDRPQPASGEHGHEHGHAHAQGDAHDKEDAEDGHDDHDQADHVDHADHAGEHGHDHASAGAGHEDHEERDHQEHGHEHPDHEHAEAATQSTPRGDHVARVTMSDAQLQQAGIAIAEAGPAIIGSSQEWLGEVRYNADRTVQVVPRLGGLVEQVAVSAGQAVRKGQVLAVLSSAELADQRAEALAAARRVAMARATHDREKKLWQEKITAEQDYLQARAALQEAEIAEQTARQKLAHLGTSAQGADKLTRFELRAPIDGIVTDRRLSVGQTVADSALVFTISDLSSVWVEAPVPVKDLAALKVGQTVTVVSGAFEGAAQGRLTFVSALLGEQARTATMRVLLANPQGQWLPGLPVKVRPADAWGQVPVAIQAEAIQTLGDGPVVFCRDGRYLEARPVKLGRRDGKLVEVLEGLSAGERYAARNSFVVKAELGKEGASHDH